VTGLLLVVALAAGPLAEPLPGWVPTEPAEVFRGSELYGHIDGGAELYLELGFEELGVQELHQGSAAIEVELYRMTDPAAALGVYLSRCGQETPNAGLTDRHTAGRHQLLLWRERYLLVVNNPTGVAALAPALVEVAGVLAARLPAPVEVSALASLPAVGRVRGSERIVRGGVGLQALVTLGEGDMLQLGGEVTAAAAAYAAMEGVPAHTLVVADYPTDTAAGAALVHLAANLDPTLTVVRRAATELDLRDFAGKSVTVRLTGRRLELRLGLEVPPSGGPPGR
jgi:hypothetical protein